MLIKGKGFPNQNLARFVRYFKIINTCFEKCTLKQIVC